METYEIFALRFATHEGRSRSENFIFHDDHDHSVMPLDFYFWVVKGKHRTFLVDTGFNAETAARRKRVLIEEPATLLRQVGVEPDDVTDVVVTHMHYDHVGNLAAFPCATFHIQDAEMAFCTGRCMCHDAFKRPFELSDVLTATRLLFSGRLKFHDGDSALAEGLTLHHLGGHTRGLQALRAWTRRGWIVLASDAAHYWANIRNRSPFPIVADVTRMFEAYCRIEDLADGPLHVIPGHDPLVRKVFPTQFGNPNILGLHLDPLTLPAAGSAVAHEPLVKATA